MPIPSGSNYKAWEMWKGRFLMTSDHRPRRRFFHICRQSLFVARNARPLTRSTRGTSASSASARSRSPTRRGPTRSRGAAPPDPGRPATRCGATRDFLPVQAPPHADAAGGLDAAAAGRSARRGARPARAVDQERRRQPDALVQGPRRLGRAGPRPRARLSDDRLRLDRQPGQRRRRPRRRRGPRVLRVHPVRPRGAEGARHRASTAPTWSPSAATTTTSTASAPSSRASTTGRS